MNYTNQTELDIKINTFLARKTGEFPELIKVKKTAWTTTFSHTIVNRLFASHTAL